VGYVNPAEKCWYTFSVALNSWKVRADEDERELVRLL
jgi:hypothetical protein